MKKLLLSLGALLVASCFLLAQNSVQFTIQHKLGDIDFALGTAATNNMGDDFRLNRLEYYISEISVIHDGGTETVFEDIHVLVDASDETTTTIDLGAADITSVELLKLHIGVDPDHNNLDPAAYPSDHPLAPQFPSMHWGWAAGYRFVALEGNGGPMYNRVIELHSLGNENYFTTEVELAATAENGTLDLVITADYTRALEDISVNGGVIVHGQVQQAQKCLENFRDYVFSPAGTISNTEIAPEVSRFALYPNPTSDGVTNVVLESNEARTYSLRVTDVMGRELQRFTQVNSYQPTQIELTQAGIYFVHLIKDGELAMTRKLVIQ